jgi:hypothetical protein
MIGARMETTDLAAIMVANFLSVFLAIALMRVSERMRRRKLAKMILEDMGEKAEMDQNFRDIINKNFRPNTESPEDRP